MNRTHSHAGLATRSQVDTEPIRHLMMQRRCQAVSRGQRTTRCFVGSFARKIVAANKWLYLITPRSLPVNTVFFAPRFFQRASSTILLRQLLDSRRYSIALSTFPKIVSLFAAALLLTSRSVPDYIQWDAAESVAPQLSVRHLPGSHSSSRAERRLDCTYDQKLD